MILAEIIARVAERFFFTFFPTALRLSADFYLPLFLPPIFGLLGEIPVG